MVERYLAVLVTVLFVACTPGPARVSEKKDFTGGPVPMASRTGRFGDVGHYTQIVWRASRTVGCALASSPTDDYWYAGTAPAATWSENRRIDVT